MRSIATFSAAILIALPLAAADEKPVTPPAQTATSTNGAQLSSAPGTTQDSPLVAAAKRSNRSAKKSKIVITNETLASAGSKAHVTTTASQGSVPQLPPAEPGADWAALEVNKANAPARAKAEAEAAAKKKAAEDEARKRRTAALAAAYEEGYSEADPGQVEKELSKLNQPPQSTTQGQPAKPPQNP